MKKVLVIAPSDLPIPATRGGAVETGIDQIISENEKEGRARIDVISFFDEKAYEESKKYKKTIFRFYKKRWIDDAICFFARSVNKVFKKMNINVVLNIRPLFVRYICKNIDLGQYDAILIKNAVNYIIPLSKCASDNIYLQLHNDFLNVNTYNALKIAKKCKAIIANSEYIKSRILTITGIKEDDVFVNKNCLSEQSFRPATKGWRIKTLSKYGVRDGDKIILFSGRLVKEKGIKELLCAVKGLNNEKKWKLLVAGSKWFSVNGKDRFMNELKTLSDGLSDNIVFLGYVPHGEISYYNSIADVVVIPSIWEEPAGRVALEAAAVGTPVIATDSGGLKEYIDTDNSIIVKKDREFIENLRKTIESVLFDDNFSSSIDRDALISFAKEYNSKRYYNEIMDYMNILEPDL